MPLKPLEAAALAGGTTMLFSGLLGLASQVTQMQFVVHEQLLISNEDLSLHLSQAAAEKGASGHGCRARRCLGTCKSLLSPGRSGRSVCEKAGHTCEDVLLLSQSVSEQQQRDCPPDAPWPGSLC